MAAERQESSSSPFSSSLSSSTHRRHRRSTSSLIPKDGLSLHDFVQASSRINNAAEDIQQQQGETIQHNPMTFHIKTYGCQMNVNDTDIVRAILLEHGFQEWKGGQEDVDDQVVVVTKKHHSKDNKSNISSTASSFITDMNNNVPDIILTNTCAIREKAEDKVWQRLRTLRKHKHSLQIVGVLGCMAERLQEKLLQQDMAQLVVGPDQYRQLPHLLQEIIMAKQNSTAPNTHAMNVELSFQETYDDIVPIRDEASNPFSAFVSIQRGCSNRW